MSPISPIRLISPISLMRLWALLALCSLMPLTSEAAQKVKPQKTASTVEDKPIVRRVAMLGFAISFKDSVVCVTEVQPMDSAYLDANHKFLLDRSLYSLQLQIHLEQAGYKNTVCNVFFDKKPLKLQRIQRKIRKKYEHDGSFHFKVLPLSEFRFKAEEYRPVVIEEETP